MKINSIGNCYTPSSYSKRNISTNCKTSPSFKADYSDKPVPPAGKAVAAASAIAIMTGAIYHGVNEFGHKDEPQKPMFEYVFNETPEEFNNNGIEDADTDDIKTLTEKHSKYIERPDTTDTLSNDTILVKDTIDKAPEPKIGHFQGHAYKIIPKGDTVVLVPMAHAKEDSSATD